MEKLIPVNRTDDIPPVYRDTPIAKLLEYHNLKKELDVYTEASLLIGMCMDNRKQLRIPDNFSFIIRTGGANLRYNEFQVSFAIGIAKVKHIALIGHNHCGMVNLFSKKEAIIDGLMEEAGWDKERAEDHFTHFSPMFEIGNEVDFVLSEAQRLRLRYPKIIIAPMMYLVEDNRLYMVDED